MRAPLYNYSQDTERSQKWEIILDQREETDKWHKEGKLAESGVYYFFFLFPLLANGNWPDIVFGFGLVSIFRYGLTMYFPEWISQYGSLRKPGMATLLLISFNPSKHDERKMSQYCQR